MSIESTWIQIATSGASADGRTIPPEWINEMAETYDMSEYTALLWFEHKRDFGDEGKVLALRAEDDSKGRRTLFAKLNPSEYLQHISRYRTLFSSIEPSKKNFAGSGKRYLLGLGITDQPASLGTDQLLFSKLDEKDDHEEQCSAWSELSFDLKQTQSIEGEEAPGWFKKLLPNLFKQNLEEDEDMSPEQFEEMKTLLGGLPDAFATKVDEKLEAQFSIQSGADRDDDDSGDKTELELLQEKFEALEAKFSTQSKDEAEGDDDDSGDKTELELLQDKFNAMEAEFSKLKTTEHGATNTPEHDGESEADQLP